MGFSGTSTTGAFGSQPPTATLRRNLAEQMGAATVAHGIAADRQVIDADPAAMLIDARAELDLLVLGSRDRGRIGSLLRRSVARELVRSPVCPTVVVPSVLLPQVATELGERGAHLHSAAAGVKR